MSSVVQDSESRATTSGPAPSYDAEQYRPGRPITDWEPGNELIWKSIGKRVANRNLWIAVPALLVAFVVWQVWSVIATNRPGASAGGPATRATGTRAAATRSERT